MLGDLNNCGIVFDIGMIGVVIDDVVIWDIGLDGILLRDNIFMIICNIFIFNVCDGLDIDDGMVVIVDNVFVSNVCCVGIVFGEMIGGFIISIMNSLFLNIFIIVLVYVI